MEPSKKRLKASTGRQTPVHQSEDAITQDGQVNLAQFLASHESNIKGLDNAMKQSGVVSSQRAFQKVPRDMRRRTASHNTKKIPQRLRARARQEMTADKTPVKKAGSRLRRPKAGESQALAPAVPSAATPDDPGGGGPVTSDDDDVPAAARVLPTHHWHAKRAKVSSVGDPFFPERTPINTNSKSVRTLHRAMHGSAVVSDLSHRGYILVAGERERVAAVLRSVGMYFVKPEHFEQWCRGCRVWAGMSCTRIDAPTDDVFGREISPARAVWDPWLESGSRQVLIEVEQHSKQELLGVLKAFIRKESDSLRLGDISVEIKDVSRLFGSIEVQGVESTRFLSALVRPFHAPGQPAHEAVHWELFRTMTEVGSTMPQDAFCLSLTVRSPGGEAGAPSQATEHPRSDGDKLHEDSDPVAGITRFIHAKDQYMTERNHPPFALLEADHPPPPPLPLDAPIPVLLLFSPPGRGASASGRWTVVCWSEHVKLLWLAMVRGRPGPPVAPGVACFEENHQLATARGARFFPIDYPTTRAGWAWELGTSAGLRRRWAATPKGKRTNYEDDALGPPGGKGGGEHGDPFSCDWRLLMAVVARAEDPAPPEGVDGGAGAGAGEGEGEGGGEAQGRGHRHWMKVRREDEEDASGTKEEMRLLSVSEELLRRHAAARSDKSGHKVCTIPALPPGGLIPVRITMTGGGVPVAQARVYRPPAGVSGTTAVEAAGEQQLLGFVTSGGYSLVGGKGVGVGYLAAALAPDLMADQKWDGRGVGGGVGHYRCLVRNVGQTLAHEARWEFLVD